MPVVSVLGPVELRVGDRLVPVRPGKDAQLLIRLALEGGRPVRTDRLLADLWGQDGGATSRNTLQAKVSSLRRAANDPGFVVAGPGGYALAVSAAEVDALVAGRCAGEAAERRRAGDAAGALAVGDRALALFRGEILADAGEGDWVLPLRARLETVHLQLLEERLSARLELGAAAELIDELTAMTDAHPLQERLWVLLITALYRSGRQADALGTYRSARGRLRDEVGVDPGPELRDLAARVLHHDTTLTVSRPVVPVTSQLPAVSSPLVGRAEDVTALNALVDVERLVSIVGAAGVGKTRLAVDIARTAAAHRRVWLVRLDTVAPGGSVLETMTAALATAQATEEALHERLIGPPALLVLDNCEHVVDAVARLVPRLLAAAPALQVLTTSQVATGIDGEITYVLTPLELSDAIELFRQRAQRTRPGGGTGTHDVSSLEKLCRALDGLPLAIELAAARTKILSISEIDRRLSDRFALLRDPAGRRPARQQALETALAWSYDLLFLDEQRTLWALSCFAGGASFDGLEALLVALDVPSDAAMDLLTRLSDRSLLIVDGAPGGPTRYRLLDSVRAYAARRLDESGQAAAAHRAQAEWFAMAADRAGQELRGPAQAEHLALARSERANLDATLSWTAANAPGLGRRIALGFGWAWFLLGDGAVGAGRIRAALATSTESDAAVLAKAYTLLAWLDTAGDVDRADASAQRAIDLARAGGTELGLARALIARAFVSSQRGAMTEQLAFLGTWRRDFPDLDRTWEAGTSWVLSAHAALRAGDLAAAHHACIAAQSIVPGIGDDWGTGHLEAVLGFLAQAEQRFDAAIGHLSRAAESAARLGFAATEGFHLSNLGRVLQQSGDDDAAIRTLERVVAIGTASGELRVAALARTRLGRVLRGVGRTDDAHAVLTAADAWFGAAGGGEGAPLAAALLAAIDSERGTPGAETRLENIRAEALTAGDTEVAVLAIDALARGQSNAGRLESARRLLSDADQLWATVAHALSDRDRLDARAVRETQLM